MHVAVVGLGALGRVYGVRLARRAGVAVTFVVRPSRLTNAPLPLAITRIDGDAATETLDAPTLDAAIPPHADVVLVCVRVEQLDASLDGLLAAAPDVPIVVLTPLLPEDLERLTAIHGPRVRVAMPGVVAYFGEADACRYWLPKVAPTLIDAAKEVPSAVLELVNALDRAGFQGRLELGVHESNPATTLALIPLAMGIDVAGGVDRLLRDRSLVDLALEAVAEGLTLAQRVGRTPPWLDLLARFAGPTSLKLGLAVVQSRSPEALHYLDEHFGRKLHAQNLTMARAIVRLADAKGTPSQALHAPALRLEGD